MSATITIDEKKKIMTIVLPMQAPTLSGSRKNFTLATTSGIQKTDAEHAGQQISVGVNAFYKNVDYVPGS